MRALVLDGDSIAGVETLQALGRAGIRVHVCCQGPDCLAFKSRYAYCRLRQPPPGKVQEFIDWLRALDEKHQYALIVPATEFSLLVLRELPERDPLRVKSVLPSNEALDIALDKQRTVDLAARLGIPVPSSQLITSLEDPEPVTEFPVVLKPLQSVLRRGDAATVLSAAIVRNEKARLDLLRTWLPSVPILQQEYIYGHGIGIEMLFHRGQEVWYFAHERIHEVPLTGGGSSYRRSLRPPENLLRATRKLLGALQWHGVAMVEFRVKADGTFCLMEINPRLWGSLALAVAAGVNFPLGLLAIATGDPPEPQPTYKENYYTRNLTSDFEWLKANFRADHDDPLLLTRPRLISFLEYFRPLFGRESWDHFDVRDCSPTWAILARIVVENSRKVKLSVQRKLLLRKILNQHLHRYSSLGSTQSKIQQVLFLCYGNICRSPFAEQVAKTKLRGYGIESAGFHPTPDRPSPEEWVHLAGSMGIGLAHLRSKRVTVAQVARADLILGMDLDTCERLAAEFPDALPRATLLGLFAAKPIISIPDPYQMTETEARQVLEQINDAVGGLSSWFNGTAEASPNLSYTGRTPQHR